MQLGVFLQALFLSAFLVSSAAATPLVNATRTDVDTPALARRGEPNPKCGPVNGNCYNNGCKGTAEELICRAGKYKGCPCGFGCAKGKDKKIKCFEKGCNGKFGRCTLAFLGCSCTYQGKSQYGFDIEPVWLSD